MSNTISNNKLNKYITCPRMVKFYYEDNLREINLNSSLFFGGAVDKGLGELLLGKTLDEAKEVFKSAMENVEHNGQVVHPSTYPHTVWAEHDYSSVFVPEDEDKKNPFVCLLYKGYEMIETYNREIMPRLSEISHVQHAVNIPNESGDIINGFIDFVAKVDGKGPYVLDNKTASGKYNETSVKTSQQLAVYSVETGIDLAGYVVLLKKPAKTVDGDGKVSHRIDYQIILDTIDESVRNLVLFAFNNVNEQIKAKKFPKNLESCDNQYGRPCPYKQYCHNNKMDGIVKIDKEKK